MSIRVRRVDGVLVALCAVETDAKPGDFVLTDEEQHALSVKFLLDFTRMGYLKDGAPIDLVVASKMKSQKVRDAEEVYEDPNHEYWLARKEVETKHEDARRQVGFVILATIVIFIFVLAGAFILAYRHAKPH